MRRTRLRGLALGAVSLTMAASLAACNGGGSSSGKDQGAKAKKAASPLHVMTAAAKKTDEAKSAKVSMTITSPSQPEPVKMEGALSWDPMAMDMTVSGMQPVGGASADAPKSVRMLWVDDTMYMDLSSSAAALKDGKKWMAFDFRALAEASGNKALADKLTAQMQQTQQSPAQQMSMMLASPNIDYVGKEKVDGVTAQHYKGSMTMKEMLDKNASLKSLSADERQKLADTMRKQGLKKADLDVWVDADGMPVRIDVAMDGKQGTTKVSEHLSDYGVRVDPQAPPASETFDIGKMLADMSAGVGAGV
jgi:hypothetical protein